MRCAQVKYPSTGFVAVIEFRSFKTQNTALRRAKPARGHLTALWRYFTSQSVLRTRQLTLDMCLMVVTTLVAKILYLCSRKRI